MESSVRTGPTPDEIIGISPATERFRRTRTVFAQDPSPLVFVGEPGVGKSLFASHIHNESAGRTCPPEPVNCAVLSEREQRIALFGAEPPELSGTRRGLLEVPGTLIVKHLDRAPHYIQEKLVNAFRRGCSVRFGSREERAVTCRPIFTFRRSPGSLNRTGHLCRALFEFCSALTAVHLPPLRRRPEDLPLLAEYFMKKFRRLHPGASWQGFDEDGNIDPDLVTHLRSHRWRDNIRDLSAYIRSLQSVSPLTEIDCREGLELTKVLSMIEEGNEFSLSESMLAIEYGIIARAFRRHCGRRTRIAQHLGISERSLRRKWSWKTRT